jgi:hypothetical protein
MIAIVKSPYTFLIANSGGSRSRVGQHALAANGNTGLKSEFPSSSLHHGEK